MLVHLSIVEVEFDMDIDQYFKPKAKQNTRQEQRQSPKEGQSKLTRGLDFTVILL